MKKQRVIFFLFLLVGIGVLNYPFISQWVNQRSQSQVIYGYDEAVEEMPDEEKQEMLSQAEAYNEKLAQKPQVLYDGFAQQEDERDTQETEEYSEYERLLDPAGNGIMGYLEIPAIDVFLPVGHGTDESVLQQGVGHLYGSSLPVGGESTHAILAAHAGISSKMLFTDLDQLREGDHFFLNILGNKLAYQVDQILTVTPDQTEGLEITEGRDLVTLVTCTPYGINSHRLLVRGERIPYEETEKEEEQAEGGFFVWGKRFFAGSVLFLVIAGVILLRPHKEDEKKDADKKEK